MEYLPSLNVKCHVTRQKKYMQKQTMFAHIKARSQRHAPTLASVCRKPTNLLSLLSQEGQGMLFFPPPLSLHGQPWLQVNPSPRAKASPVSHVRDRIQPHKFLPKRLVFSMPRILIPLSDIFQMKNLTHTPPSDRPKNVFQ